MPLAIPVLICAAALTTRAMSMQAGEPTAAELLKDMAGVYASLKSYQDTATGETEVLGSTAMSRSRTAFIKPDKLRLEFESSTGDRHTYVIDGEQAMHVRGGAVSTTERKRPSVLLSGAVGASVAAAGVGKWVISLLLEDFPMPGHRLTNLKDPRRLADGMVDGKQCYVIEGNQGEVIVTAWIDRKTSLIRRVDEKGPFLSSSAKFYPDLDAKVNDRDFEL